MSTAIVNDWVETIDQYGKGAWIALMVLGFILFWPIGLALLAYLIWSGRMGCHGRRHRAWSANRWHKEKGWSSSSGNSAFDEYREETLRRLEEEQKEFARFLDELRKAKDKAQFDQFMKERERRATSPDAQEPPPAGATS